MSAEAIAVVARRGAPVRALPGYDLESCVAKARRALKLPASRLLEECCEAVARDRAGTVDLLVHLAAIEARRVHRKRGCGSVFEYCTQVLGMCEATASRRIGAARAARRFPVILPMLADGRLHVTAVKLLSEHLTPANVASLLAEATHQSKAQVERLVARRFPKPDVATAGRPLATAMASAAQAAQVVANMGLLRSPVSVVLSVSSENDEAMGPVSEGARGVPGGAAGASRDDESGPGAGMAAQGEAGAQADDPARASSEPATGLFEMPGPSPDATSARGESLSALRETVQSVVFSAAAQSDSGALPEAVLTNITNAMTQTLVRVADGVPVATSAGDARVSPRSEGRFAWQLTADQEMQDLFEEARELIGFNGARELPDVLRRGLQMLVQALRKARFAETDRPRRAEAPANARHVPAHVKREVAERDGHQCAYVSDDGKRCSERTGLQYDHVIPIARGGQSTVENTRLLCGQHNQLEAERVFGEAHVREQREAERARREHARAGKQEAARRVRERASAGDAARDSGANADGSSASAGDATQDAGANAGGSSASAGVVTREVGANADGSSASGGGVTRGVDANADRSRASAGGTTRDAGANADGSSAPVGGVTQDPGANVAGERSSARAECSNGPNRDP